MYIDDEGWLCNDFGDLIQVSRTTGRHYGKRIGVELFVQHYAVTHNLDATVAAQRYRGYWAHYSADGFKDGKRSVLRVVQAVPFGVQGSHALGFNTVSIGGEIANPGPLFEEAGQLRTTYGKRWDRSDAIETGPVRGYPSTWTWWAKYSDEEMAIQASIGLAIKQRRDLFPAFRDIVGHHEIDPKRKFDPGPTDYDVSAIDGSPVPVVFPMRWLRDMVFPEQRTLPPSSGDMLPGLASDNQAD